MSEAAPAAHPRAAPELEIVQTGDGYVVYHEERDRVHYLNHTAVLVLELCTGANSTEEIVSLMQRAYDLPGPPVDEIRACLESLRAEGLVA